MYCVKCGKQMDDNAKACAYCGTPVGSTPDVNSMTKNATAKTPDAPSLGFAVLGFLFRLSV